MSLKSQNTKRAAKVLPVLKDDYVVWDDVLSQLGRRVRKSRETWIVQIGKPKLRLHDPCHSFALVAVNSRLDLQVVGGLLGHSDLGTTAGLRI